MSPEQDPKHQDLREIQAIAACLASRMTAYANDHQEQLHLRVTRLVENNRLLMQMGVEVK